jgi:hypothetical protein
MKRSWIIVALLAVSLCANIYLWARSPGSDGVSASGSRRGPMEESGQEGEGAAQRAAVVAGCPQELKRCEATAWRMVAETIRLRESKAAQERSGDARASTSSAIEPSTNDEQTRFRRKLAVEHLQRQWLRDRDKIVAGVAKDLADAPKQAHKVRTEVERFSKALGLSSPEEALLLERYEPIRRDHLERLRRALVAEPPDYVEALQVLRGLYRAEDRLVFDIFGVEAKKRLRASELRSRTAILAIAGTFAGLDWDDERLSW